MSRKARSPYMAINPAVVELFDTSGLDAPWEPLIAYQTGEGIEPYVMYAPMLFHPYHTGGVVTQAMRIAGQEIPDALAATMTPYDRLFVRAARLAAWERADQQIHPDLGRSTYPLYYFVDRFEWLTYTLETVKAQEFYDAEHLRGIMLEWFDRAPRDFKHLFTGWLGPQSIGWLNAEERKATLQACVAARSADTKETLRKMWTEDAEGDPEEFEELWTAYERVLRSFTWRIKKVSFKGTYRPDASFHRRLFQRVGTGHTPEEVYAWALERYEEVATELGRLAKSMGYSNPSSAWHALADAELPEGEALVAQYRRDAMAGAKLMRRNGFWSRMPAGVTTTFEVMSEGKRAQFSSAYTTFPEFCQGKNRKATIAINPYGRDPESLVVHGRHSRRLIALHEYAHVVSSARAPYLVRPEFNTRGSHVWGLEMLGFGYERLLAEADGSMEMVFAMLLGRARRIARVLLELGYRLDHSMNLEQHIELFAARCGLPLEDARADALRGLMNEGELVAYYMGTCALEQLARLMGMSFGECVEWVQCTTGGWVPPWWIAEALGLVEKAEDFNLLVDQDGGVALSRRMFPTAVLYTAD